MDAQTWNRARGWALWKALITYNGNRYYSNPTVAEESLNIINLIVEDIEL